MQIEIISMWYNEEFLAPLFLQHYAFADRITVLFDTDTTDGTLELLRACPKVTVVPVNSGDKLNDFFMRDTYNKQYLQSTADWIVVADADEFIFPLSHDYDLRKYLESRHNLPENVIKTKLCAVFRHVSDVDIDRTKPPIFQRRHGIPEGASNCGTMYHKPVICRPQVHAGWAVGRHSLYATEKTKISAEMVFGTHWRSMDPAFAVARQLSQSSRMSQANINAGFASLWRTEATVLEDMQRHIYDPKLF